MTLPPAVRIAVDGLDSIYSIQEGFLNIKAVLTLIQDHPSAKSPIPELTLLGLLEVEDWLTRSAQWADLMQTELDNLCIEGFQ
ncbi:hypothetical protein [uncultured Pseudomonas sp.]|uniref:hypothetical protein n=1 Tax=uncultured Pseudomonas sp. TaxID=114707 RepID=UPI0025F900DE|nr:hypothetical protein [uncultured Pseudomonas sp.]